MPECCQIKYSRKRNQATVKKDGKQANFDDWPVNVNFNSNGVDLYYDYNPGDANDNIGTAVEGISKL